MTTTAQTPQRIAMRDYVVVTAGYWAFTLTDGALRMLVLLHFHELGYSPVALAFIFVLYEAMGIVTNLIGGWVGSRTGLNRTLVWGLAIQVTALLALTVQDPSWAQWASVVFVMGVQAMSGVAKDLTKMSAKSSVKLVAGSGSLFRLVALLTGSKNALKGVGFFAGAALLSSIGYDEALLVLAAALATVLITVVTTVSADIGRAQRAVPLRSVVSTSTAINRLSAARLFLFGSRDIWFVVALPIFLTEQLGWSFEAIGAFLATWVIGYGAVQSIAHRLVTGDHVKQAKIWAFGLAAVAAAIAVLVATGVAVVATVVIGVVVFGVVFAANSSLHSFLILAYSDTDVAMDVGYYYSANAAGRLIGTVLSGVVYLWGGLEAALWGSAAFLSLTWLLSLRLPDLDQEADGAEHAEHA